MLFSQTVFTYFATIILIIFLIFTAIRNYLALKRCFWKRKYEGLISIAFFHPYCVAGGGGERVLWNAIRALQETYDNAHFTVYTGDKVAPSDIMERIESYFCIKLIRPIQFVYLNQRNWVEDKYYPYFTLLFQSFGSIILGLEAIFKHVPDIYVDSMGYAWTFPIFKYLGSCKVGAYVHYPTISTDMLHAVEMRRNTVNNRRFVSNSRLFSYVKIIYYKLFAFFYGLMGHQSEVIMVNSSWTKNHILELWKRHEKTFVVYPPCDVSNFENIPIEKSVDQQNFTILSIAQFRPEKDHELQINAFHNFLSRTDKNITAMLVLVGSCRNEEDSLRVENLKKLCKELQISERVKFKINLSFQEVIQQMKNASVALHTMWNEHFGIGIVECMSAGLIMIAHDSGGPKMDIISNSTPQRTGFLASDVNSYADALLKVYKMSSEELYEIRKNARNSVRRFSVAEFEKSFLNAFKLLFL